MLTIEQENRIQCALTKCETCECKMLIEQFFHCQLLPCEYESYKSLLQSCWDSYVAMEENKKYRREYPNGR